MNKAQLVDSVAAATDMSKADAGRAVDATLSAVAGSLASGDSVALVGFGTFNVRHRAARMGRNPQTVSLYKYQLQNQLVSKLVKHLKKVFKFRFK
ncbi:MAG: hypothetical protein Ct9H90mP4_14650 [Gammaproteobacteria bacterium]|nr:MAG: hypothetical protein Ct9H90mP4_14650 [Gammaproteobacteria bacterium]